MQIFDTHCDTISRILDSGEGLYKNNAHIDIERMRKYSHYTQFFAAFIGTEYSTNAYRRCINIIDKFDEEIEKNKEYISFCRDYNDLEKSKKDKKISAFLSIENGECIDTVDRLYEFYERGVRAIALTWNHSNNIASGVMDENPSFGLTEFGREIVREMNKLGIMIDVSHISDKAFWEIMSITQKPIIATHSNLRSVCSSERNLTDEQFKAVVECGGCVGVNLYPPFLNDSGKATFDDIRKHIDKFLALGGEDSIGIGADFDGVDYLPNMINSCSDLKTLFETNLNFEYGQIVISKLKYGNFERLLRNNI